MSESKRLLGDCVLIEPDTIEEVTPQGLTIKKTPENGDFMIGTVRYVGTGKHVEGGRKIEVDLEIGDRVIFQYGQKFKINNEILLLVVESDVKFVL